MTTAEGCLKVPYSSRPVAERALMALFWPGMRRRSMRRCRPDEVLMVYECESCGYFHLGHSRRPKHP